MTDTYRLSWEMVGVQHLHLYCNADPRIYSKTTQVVPNSAIPDEHWHKVSRETDDPWGQHSTLRVWAAADTDFVRNVVLEKMDAEPTWSVVDPPSPWRCRCGEVFESEAALFRHQLKCPAWP